MRAVDVRASRALALLVVAFLVGACASYQLPPVSTSHPAHPDAPAAPARERSETLAYAPSDIPSPQPVPSVAAAPPDAARPGAPPATARRTVVGEGEVVSAVPRSGQIVLDHAEIEGFMEAMTMGYQVDPPSLLGGLKEGDAVRFTIDVQRRAIVAIEKLR